MEKVIFLFMRRMRRPLVMLIASYAVAISGLVIIPGQDSNGNVWHYDFFHAFYFISFVGPTIGFGEIPYELVPAQRFWVVVSLYLTVIAWLYSIGKIFGLVQETAFVRALEEARFIRSVRRLDEPFHIVCGYGQTGSLIVESLSVRGWRCVVLDSSSERLDDLELANLPLDIPRRCADAATTQALIEAGLKLDHCRSVIAVTNSDEVNTKIAVTVKLLVPQLMVICRAETNEAMENMASFNTDHIINPFEVFAEHMALAIEKPCVNELHRRLGARAGRRLADPLTPPKGQWLLGGFGRFGQACRRQLENAGIEVSVIERDPERYEETSTESLRRVVIGSATDPSPLREAGIESCNGIIAGMDSDTDNLSMVLTALEINPGVYTVARQSSRDESEIFAAAKLPLVVEPSRLLAWRVLPLATNPKLNVFLTRCREQDNAWAEVLIKDLQRHFRRSAPQVLNIVISNEQASGLYKALSRRTVRIADLKRNAHGEPLPLVPLMLTTAEETILCPGSGQTLEVGDELLLACSRTAGHRLEWFIQHSAHWASPGITPLHHDEDEDVQAPL